VYGVGLAAVPLGGADGEVVGARATARDLFLRDVRSSTIRFDASGHTAAPTGRLVAYGLHVADGSALDVRRAVLDGGGFGFFVAAGGRLALRTAVITRQLDAVGASNTAADALGLEDVVRRGNAGDDVVLRDLDLPGAASLPLPTPVCSTARCP
jgi:hypothetical protein